MALFYLPNSYDFLFSFLFWRMVETKPMPNWLQLHGKKTFLFVQNKKVSQFSLYILQFRFFSFSELRDTDTELQEKTPNCGIKCYNDLFLWTILLIWRHLFTAVYGYLRILTFFLQFIVFISQFRLFNPLRIARKKSEIKCHCYLYWLIVMWQKQTSMLQSCYCLKETFKTVTRFHSWFSCIMHKNDFKD